MGYYIGDTKMNAGKEITVTGIAHPAKGISEVQYDDGSIMLVERNETPLIFTETFIPRIII